MGTEIREVHQAVGIQDTDHTHISEVQSFRQHLGPDQYLRLSLLEIGDYPFISRTGTRRVEVQAFHFGCGEKCGDLLFHHFRSETHRPQFRNFAHWTLVGQLDLIPAIMANQFVTELMVRQSDIAVHAMGHPTTTLTLDHRSKTTPVLEQNRLLSPFQRRIDLFDQYRREKRIFHNFLTPQLLDVDRQYLRHQTVAIAGGKLDQAIFAGSRIKIGIDRRGGRP